MTKPSGRVVGVDIIPAQPPKGVSTIQGNFLSPHVQASIRSFLRDPDRGRTLRPQVYTNIDPEHAGDVAVDAGMARGYIDRERQESLSQEVDEGEEAEDAEKTVDVVLSDMCEPWEQTTGFFNRTLSNPYHRMMNTSGNNFRDHAGSMVSLCRHSAVHVASIIFDQSGC
jgi:21S rRNA (uridine2791-2'-O)-methyltransferase